jgi:hypothetical protein
MVEPFILILIFLLPPAVFFGVLRLSKWKRGLKGQRRPFEDKLLRSPGYSLGRDIQNMSEEVAAHLLAFCTYPLLLYCLYLKLPFFSQAGVGVTFLMWASAAIVTVYFMWKALTLVRRRRDLRIGMAGELAAGEELNRLMFDGYHVYHDFPAERFNIDHILVGASGVFAVETKARSKGSRGNRMEEAKVIYDGECLRFPSWVTSEPMDQAKAQATWLSKWLSGAVGEPVRVSPMVTIPGRYIERKSPNGIPVLNPKQVKSYLDDKKETVLSEKLIKSICHQFEQKCRDVDLWDWY